MNKDLMKCNLVYKLLILPQRHKVCHHAGQEVTLQMADDMDIRHCTSLL